MKATLTKILPETARLDNYWTPSGIDTYQFRRESITLLKGTMCADRGDKWEVVSGEHDGVIFAKWNA